MGKSNMRVLLTFLGTGDYKRTAYEFNKTQSHVEGTYLEESPFAVVCMAKIWKPDKIIVFATSQAQQQNGDKLRSEAAGFSLEWVSIPEGRDKEELIQIFRRLNESVLEGSEVVMDVTHSFRSIPIIGLAAIHYLKFAKNVEIKHIWYGAYSPNRSGPFPVIDLQIFSEIIDWIWAIRIFRETGETKPLASLLREYHAYFHEQGDKDPKVQPVGRSLERLGALIAGVQVLALQKQAANAYTVLQRGRKEGRLGEVPPLLPKVVELLEEKLQELHVSYSPSALPEEKAFQQLKAQYSLLLAYLEWNRPAQALILFREWLVSVALFILGGYEGIFLDEGFSETALKEFQRLRQGAETLLGIGKVLALEKEKAEAFQRIIPIWHSISQRRNTIAHAGMNAGGYDKQLLEEAMLKELQEKANEVWRLLLHLRNKPETTHSRLRITNHFLLRPFLEIWELFRKYVRGKV